MTAMLARSKTNLALMRAKTAAPVKEAEGKTGEHTRPFKATSHCPCDGLSSSCTLRSLRIWFSIASAASVSASLFACSTVSLWAASIPLLQRSFRAGSKLAVMNIDLSVNESYRAFAGTSSLASAAV